MGLDRIRLGIPGRRQRRLSGWDWSTVTEVTRWATKGERKMKRPKIVRAALALAVGLYGLAGGPRRGSAGDHSNLRSPDVTGCWLGTYQNELNRDDCGTVVVEIVAQGRERLVGRMVVRGRGYVLEGMVTPSGEATLVGFEPGSDLPGPQWIVQGRFAVLVDNPTLLRRRCLFIGSGIADLGRCCSRPVTLVLHGPG
jgi:hypothetical protein